MRNQKGTHHSDICCLLLFIVIISHDKFSLVLIKNKNSCIVMEGESQLGGHLKVAWNEVLYSALVYIFVL